MDYTSAMFDIVQSEAYKIWFAKLKDRQAIARINARIRRISESGHFGDMKPISGGVHELRVDCGPGYQIYYMRSGSIMVVLLGWQCAAAEFVGGPLMIVILAVVFRRYLTPKMVAVATRQAERGLQHK